MKLIYKAKDITEAHIVSGMLNSNGIKAHVSGYYLQGGVGELAAMDFANVHVADEDVPSAKLIITEYEGAPKKTKEEIKIKKATLTSRVFIAILAITFIISIFLLVTSMK